MNMLQKLSFDFMWWLNKLQGYSPPFSKNFYLNNMSEIDEISKTVKKMKSEGDSTSSTKNGTIVSEVSPFRNFDSAILIKKQRKEKLEKLNKSRKKS